MIYLMNTSVKIDCGEMSAYYKSYLLFKTH